MNLDRSGPVLCFGEVLLRLSTRAGTRIANCSDFAAHVGGAEANVGALLAQVGTDVKMITVLPRCSLGDLCEAELRRVGMRTDKVLRSDGRLGLFRTPRFRRSLTRVPWANAKRSRRSSSPNQSIAPCLLGKMLYSL